MLKKRLSFLLVVFILFGTFSVLALSVSAQETAANINDDGLDITDATMIQRHLAMMAVPYPIGEVIN